MNRITVLMAVRNGGSLVAAAIESILEQSFTDFELLVIDDGSTDDTAGRLRAMADPRLRVIGVDHMGLGSALQVGLERADGEYVARLDADDVSHPDRLALQVAYLDAHPEIALVGARAIVHDGAGTCLGMLDHPRSPTWLAWELQFDNCLVSSSVMFRRRQALEVGGYHPADAEDYDLWSRLARAYGVANLDRTLVAYRLAPTGWHAIRESEIRARALAISTASWTALLAGTPWSGSAADVALLHRPQRAPSPSGVPAAVEALLHGRDRYLESVAPVGRDRRHVARSTWRTITAVTLVEASPARLRLVLRLVALSGRSGAGAPRTALTAALAVPATLVGGGRSRTVRRLAARLLRSGRVSARAPRVAGAGAATAFGRLLREMGIADGRADAAPTVALVIDHADGGGAERMVADLAAGLADRGHRVILCHTRTGPSPQDRGRLLAAGVELLCLGRRSRLRVDRWWPLVRVLRRERVDVLASHLDGSNLWCSILRMVRPSMALVATEHSAGVAGPRVGRALNRLVVRRACDRFVGVSAQSGVWLEEVVGVEPAKVVVILNGASREIPERGDPEVRRLRRQLAANVEQLVGTVGMLRPQKRVDLLLAAFAHVRSELPMARLVIVGDGPERAALEAQAAELPPSAVSFMGWRDDVGTLLATLDLFVMCSEVEGAPLALVEAMGAGLGIVATDVGGVAELAPDGECAVLVPAGDIGALAAGITDLLGDAARRRRLGDAARARARRDLSATRMLDAWSDLLGDVVRERRRTR